MKTRLTRISPLKLALLFATFGLLGSALGIIFLLTTPMTEGVTITLSGFNSMTFSNSVNYGMVILHPILNTVFGLIAGFVMALIYNLWAKISGGLNFELSEEAEQGAAANP